MSFMPDEIKGLKSNLAKMIKSKGKNHFVKVIDNWSKPFLKGKPEVEGLDYLDCNPYKDESGMIDVEKILPGKLLYYIFERGFQPTGLIKDILIAALYTYLNMGVIYPAENIEFDVLVASIKNYYPENAYYFLDITGGQEPAETEQVNNGENINDNMMSSYLEINLAERTLVVGEVTYDITSQKIWAYLRTLAYDRKRNEVTKIQDGYNNWKNARDMLRRKIGKEVLRHMIPSSKGTHALNKSVVIKGGGQVSIRRTKSNQHKIGVN